MVARIPCIVPHCRRTTRADDPVIEWPDTGFICSGHWRLVPPNMKAVKRRARIALRRDDRPETFNRFCRVSARCTRAALDRAGGL